MKKLVSISVLSTAFLFGGALPVFAETPMLTSVSDAVTTQAQVTQLLQQIEQLKTQLAELQKNNASLQGQVMQLTTRLHRGMKGEEVKRLQEVLATDKDIFLKENATGYYGAMTEKAVENFQKHFGLDPVGEVGPRTLTKINELLKEHDVSEQDLSDDMDGDLGDLGDENEGVESDNMSSGATSPAESEGEKKGGN